MFLPNSQADAILTIDLDAIVANWRLLATRAAPARTAAVLKADAYGLGAAKVGPALAKAGCKLFFVAQVGEGIELRAALDPIDPGRASEIAVFNGAREATHDLFVEHALIPVLNDQGAIALWLAACRGEGIARPAILQIDSGMNRAGVEPRWFDRIVADPEVQNFPWRALMTHLACADQPAHPLNRIQLTVIRAAAARLPGVPVSIAASGGLTLGAEYHGDLVRPGASLYGIDPRAPDAANAPLGLAQPVSLTARILQVRYVDPGGAVGYGATHRVDGTTAVATIALGYADGFPRSAGGRGTMLLHGREVPVIGRVSMDLITLDVTSVGHAAAGDWVTVLGPHRTPDDLARDAGTIGWEILTSLGRRYQRRYVGAA